MRRAHASRISTIAGRATGRPVCLRIHIGLIVAALFLCLTHSGFAEVIRTTLVVGEEWTTVHEVRRVQVQAGEQELILEGIPDTADLSSLALRTRRIPVQLLSWSRGAPSASRADRAEPNALRVTPTGQVLAGPNQPMDKTEANLAQPVVCRIRFPVAGTQVFSVHYRMRGIHWTADYQVSLRGRLDDPEEQMAVALKGFLRFNNESDRDFDQAIIRVTGGDPRIPRRPRRAPGILMTIEGPLADIWHHPEVVPQSRDIYRVPHPVTLPGRSRTDVVFADAPRIPATRLYVMESARIPLSRLGNFHPLEQFLVFPNAVGAGLGESLPPGPVALYQGIARRALQREGFLPHTLPGQEIRVALGPTAEVTGMRRSFGRTARVDNQQEELFELGVQNDRASPVTVEIRERPPASLGWTLLRITEDFEDRRGVIVMRPRVAGGERRRIDLRLRLQVPEPI